MGATMARMASQGHELYVAYQTSGNLAVLLDEIVRKMRFAWKLAHELNLKSASVLKSEIDRVSSFIINKKSGEVTPQDIYTMQGLVRKVECHRAAMKCGVKEDNIFFLDLPFYQTGSTKKNN